MIKNCINHLISKTFLVFVFILVCSDLFGSDFQQVIPPGKATVAKNKIIELDISQPLQKQYEVSISSFKFSSQEQAQIFFQAITDPYVDFTIDFPSQKVLINLHPTDSPERPWTVNRWNNYLKSKIEYSLKN